ncbi:HAMP domain-containing protein [Desulfosarcina cetonica]|uniref:HAMP domain-containing protein n=1 Tax=Desulfosarcina cetonica TaxID=90730 RepID=UPI0006D17104|nr:methyl-accepting chemotaxis protein [Desulfosarcina cetonica]
MKLQTKLIFFQVLLLILVIAIAQIIQYKKMTHAVSAFSAANLQVMRDREERAAKNIFYSVNHAVAGSLERGEMEKFSRLLEDQRQLEGLLEFSLQDRKGVVTHSTDRRLLATAIPEDVKTQLFDKPEMLLKWNQDDVEIYKPLRVSNDCIRCHTDWNRDDIGGIVHFRFSKAAITTAETQAAGILSSMKSTALKSAAFSLCGIVLVLAVAMHFLVKKLVGAPLRKINLRLHDIAEGEGDLTARIQVAHADEIGSLAISFNIFVEKLQEMVKNIAENAVMLSESSSDLSDMSGKMSEDSDQMSRRSKTAAEAASVMNSSMRSVALTMKTRHPTLQRSPRQRRK